MGSVACALSARAVKRDSRGRRTAKKRPGFEPEETGVLIPRRRVRAIVGECAACRAEVRIAGGEYGVVGGASSKYGEAEGVAAGSGCGR